MHLISGTQPIYWETAFLNKFHLVEKNTCTGTANVHLLLYYIMWQGQRERGKFPLCLIRHHYMKTCTEWSGLQFLAYARDLFFPQNVQTGCLVHPASYSMGTCSSFPGQSRQEEKLPTHLFYLVPTLWIRGTIPLLPLYGFTSSTQTYLYGNYEHLGDWSFKSTSW